MNNTKDENIPAYEKETVISERGGEKRIIPVNVAGKLDRIRTDIPEEQILAAVNEMESILDEVIPEEITEETSDEAIANYLLSLKPLEPSDVPVHEVIITHPSGIRKRVPEPEPPTPANIAAEICESQGFSRGGLNRIFETYPRKPGDLRPAQPLRELTEIEKEKYK